MAPDFSIFTAVDCVDAFIGVGYYETLAQSLLTSVAKDYGYCQHGALFYCW